MAVCARLSRALLVYNLDIMYVHVRVRFRSSRRGGRSCRGAREGEGRRRRKRGIERDINLVCVRRINVVVLGEGYFPFFLNQQVNRISGESGGWRRIVLPEESRRGETQVDRRGGGKK